MENERQNQPGAMLARLVERTNAHDLAGVVDCFTPDYRNETPAHPARGFEGQDQVRQNWEQIFRLVPNISVDVVRAIVDGDTVWSEWDMRGTRGDGSVHHMRGVIIFGVRDGRANWARFYLEPVQVGGEDVNEAVRRAVSPAAQATS